MEETWKFAGEVYLEVMLCNRLGGKFKFKLIVGRQVDETGSGSCSVAGFGISSVEPSGSATTKLVRWILVRQVVRMGGGWNWFRIVSNGRLCY
jgi:hypothetical protein